MAPYPMKMNRRRSSSWEEVVEEPQARCCTLAKSYRGWLRFFNAVFLVTGEKAAYDGYDEMVEEDKPPPPPNPRMYEFAESPVILTCLPPFNQVLVNSSTMEGAICMAELVEALLEV